MIKLSQFVIFITLLVFVSNVLCENFDLLILHNNDAHAHFEETSVDSRKCGKTDKLTHKCVGGFARMAHVIRQARKDAEEGKGPHVLYLNAGDTYTGTPWYNVHKWKIVVDCSNLLHPDAASYGNHEFDDGISGLLPYLNATNYPVLAANLDFSQEPLLKEVNLTKSTVLNVSGKLIGIIGYLTPTTATIAGQTTNVIFNEEIYHVKKESELLNARGVKIIIALGHSGFEMDKRIAKEVPFIDVVVGGHTNTFLWNGPQPSIEEPQGPYPFVVERSNGKKVPVVQAYAHAKYLGRLHVSFNESGDVISYHGQPVFLNNSVPQEQDVLNVLDKYRPEVAVLEQVVGKSKVYLEACGWSFKIKECNFGNLLADALVAYYAVHYLGPFWSDAPISLVNTGIFRDHIEPDPVDHSITRDQIMTAIPYDDDVMVMSLNGTDLLRSLEIGVDDDVEVSPVLQVSGIRYRVNLTKPIGSRIGHVVVRCAKCRIPVYTPLDLQETYRVVVPKYVSNGGDGHYILKESGYDRVRLPLNVTDIFEWYLQNVSMVFAEEEGRINLI